MNKTKKKVSTINNKNTNFIILETNSLSAKLEKHFPKHKIYTH